MLPLLVDAKRQPRTLCHHIEMCESSEPCSKNSCTSCWMLQEVPACYAMCSNVLGHGSLGRRHCSTGRLGMQAAKHMEWVDDVLMFMRKGAGSPRAYQMAAPLLADIATSLQVTLVTLSAQCTAHSTPVSSCPCVLVNTGLLAVAQSCQKFLSLVLSISLRSKKTLKSC